VLGWTYAVDHAPTYSTGGSREQHSHHTIEIEQLVCIAPHRSSSSVLQQGRDYSKEYYRWSQTPSFCWWVASQVPFLASIDVPKPYQVESSWLVPAATCAESASHTLVN
jgi:hypothetical protein